MICAKFKIVKCVKKLLRNEGVIKHTRLGELFFLVKSFQNQCIAVATDLFLKFFRRKKNQPRCAFYYPLIPYLIITNFLVTENNSLSKTK